MGFLKWIFTWWNDATFGTLLMTRLRGQAVGSDGIGNRYYTERNGGKRRWVIYNGEIEASRVPAEWNAWLHHTSDTIPSDTSRHGREQPLEANLTGTPDAVYPSGSIVAGGRRPQATGDYEPWRPA